MSSSSAMKGVLFGEGGSLNMFTSNMHDSTEQALGRRIHCMCTCHVFFARNFQLERAENNRTLLYIILKLQ